MDIISICLFFVFGINNEAVRFPIIIRISGKTIVFYKIIRYILWNFLFQSYVQQQVQN